MFRALTACVLLVLAVSSAPAASPVQADELIEKLSKIRIDKSQIYSIRDITIRRDVLSISLNRGTIAFTEGLGGKVTSAVFLGSGEILAIPPDRVEKQQMHRYTSSALLNERFETAVFWFTDSTYEEILKEYKIHAAEEVEPGQVNEILRWDAELQRRSRFLNGRILADLFGKPTAPFFLAQIEGAQLGWFDAIYDERRVEEILIEQNVVGAPQPVVWASFDKRSEARLAEPRPVEDKELIELVSYSAAGPVGLLNVRLKPDGERVIQVPVPVSSPLVSASIVDGPQLPFFEGGDHVSLVLPEPSKSGQILALQLTYGVEAPVDPGFRNPVADAVTPASYRDQWIVDGLAGYAPMVTAGALPLARAQLLETSPEGGTYESLGPISIGYRMTQPGTTARYAAALRNKSVWVLHMLRMLMRSGDSDSVFAAMIVEFKERFDGKRVSTYDFRRLAENHAAQDLEWFFEQWVTGTGVPAYTVEYKVNPVAGGFAIQGRISQSGVPETFTMPVPLYADDVFLGRVTVSGEEGEFRFVTPTQPQQIRIDPQGTILAIVR